MRRRHMLRPADFSIADKVIHQLYSATNLQLLSDVLVEAMEEALPESHAEIEIRRASHGAFEIHESAAAVEMPEQQASNAGTRRIGPFRAPLLFVVELPSSRFAPAVLKIRRAHGRFTNSERELVHFLYPHICQAWQNACVFAQTLRTQNQLEEIADVSCLELVKLTWDLVLLESRPRAICWLWRYSGKAVEPGERLPDVIHQWVEPQLQNPANPSADARILQLHRGNARLIITVHHPDASRPVLLLREDNPERTFQRLNHAGLSPRESEALQWMVQGKTNPEIATLMHVSSRTAEKHVQHILNKLHLENRQAVMALWHDLQLG